MLDVVGGGVQACAGADDRPEHDQVQIPEPEGQLATGLPAVAIAAR